jgi:hypothetical protein
MVGRFPDWLVKEVNNAEWAPIGTWNNTGYILDIEKGERRLDVEFYEKLPDGRHIITIDVPPQIGLDGLEKGVIYRFTFKAYRAELSPRAIEYLSKEFDVALDAIYRFELVAVERVEEE